MLGLFIIYLFIYLFLRNATFNMCKIHQYNQNLSGAIRHNSVLTTTPLKEKENNNNNNNNKICYTSYFKCSDKSVLHTERLNAFALLKLVDSGKLFQTFITLHAKKRLLAEVSKYSSNADWHLYQQGWNGRKFWDTWTSGVPDCLRITVMLCRGNSSG